MKLKSDKGGSVKRLAVMIVIALVLAVTFVIYMQDFKFSSDYTEGLSAEEEKPAAEFPGEINPAVTLVPFVLLAILIGAILIWGVATAAYPQAISHIQAYIPNTDYLPQTKEWLWWKPVPVIAEKAKISEFKVKEKKDFREVINFMREGPAMVFINTKEMRLGEIDKLKSAVKTLKKTVDALHGDVLGMGTDYILATSFGIRIQRSEKELKTDEKKKGI